MLNRIKYQVAQLAWQAAGIGKSARHRAADAIFLIAALTLATAVIAGIATLSIAAGYTVMAVAHGLLAVPVLALTGTALAAVAAPNVEQALRRRWYAAAIVAGKHLHCRPLP